MAAKTTKKAQKAGERPPMKAQAPSDPMSVGAPVEPLLEEMRAFYESILPADMAADWHLATTLYLETHPVMQDRLHAMLGRRIEKSAAVPVVQDDLVRGNAAAADVKRIGRR